MLKNLLLQRSSSILDRWLDELLETYPPDAKRFLKKQKDRFANPVGTTLSRELEFLYRELIQGVEEERVSPILDRIIRIRAVQDFSPSQAVAFVFTLKGIIRSEVEREVREKGFESQLSELESSIDDLVLIAFDVYMKCREKIFDIRVREAHSHVSRLLRRAGLVCEFPEKAEGQDEGSEASTS